MGERVPAVRGLISPDGKCFPASSKVKACKYPSGKVVVRANKFRFMEANHYPNGNGASGKKIRVAIIGVGNCASALVQGVEFYQDAKVGEAVPGLMHINLGGYHIHDIEFSAAFDINQTKVGRDLAEAIFAEPNNTIKFSDVPPKGIPVQRGMTHDGLGKYLNEVITKAPGPTDDIVGILKATRTDVVVSYLPVGSEMATKWYVEQVLEAGCAFINCIPVFIASQPYWQKRFAERGLPVIGDDIKSQVGATITHRVLTNLFRERGVRLDHTYQLNFGGNTDFMNMLERDRLESKKISKTNAVTSQLDVPLSNHDAHVGPSDYVPWLADRKWCYIRMEGTTFGNVPLNCEVKLEVWDSPNSAGVVIDAIRCAKLALDHGIGGALVGPASYFMKSPPRQFTDNEARQLTEAFIAEHRRNDDRSNQAVERAEQPVALGLPNGSRLEGVCGDDANGRSRHPGSVPEAAVDPRRDLAN
ncbi:MAG: Myo-inositol-phosphate synthase [Pedosphaera sp.]|nr:Myo-inositol-phosphate synthase [Pedosphaera sp.]